MKKNYISNQIKPGDTLSYCDGGWHGEVIIKKLYKNYFVCNDNNKHKYENFRIGKASSSEGFIWFWNHAQKIKKELIVVD